MVRDDAEDAEPPEADDEKRGDSQEAPEETADDEAVRDASTYVGIDATGTGGDVIAAGGDIHKNSHNQIVINVYGGDPRKVIDEVRRELSPKPPPPPPHSKKIKKVCHWFEYDLPDDRQRWYALTLAIFQGVKFSDYITLREKIATRMGYRPPEDEPPPSPFVKSADKALTDKVKTVKDGERADTIISYADEEYATSLIELLQQANAYHDVGLKLMLVLRDIAIEYHAWDIRERAAKGVADLGQRSFRYMCENVLNVWARDERAYVRATAGYSLRRLAEGDVCRNQVLALLDEWSRPGRDQPGPAWRYRWAAASAYKQIGYIDQPWASPRAIGGLRELAGNNNIAVMNAVIHSMLVHSLTGESEMKGVLLALKQWIEEGSAGNSQNTAPRFRCLTGILTLMFIADVHLKLATEPDDEYPFPNLFDLVRAGQIDRDDFWQLMIVAGVRSFEFQQRPGILWLIERWSDHVDDDHTLADSIVRLITDLYGALHHKKQTRLFNRLQRWEQQSKNKSLSACAARARVEIMRGGQTHGHIVFGN